MSTVYVKYQGRYYMLDDLNDAEVIELYDNNITMGASKNEGFVTGLRYIYNTKIHFWS